MSGNSMLSLVKENLYAKKPDCLLYHYTGYPALLSIAKSSELWATDIHYFNDSSELNYAVSLFHEAVKIASSNPQNPENLIRQLQEWLKMRLTDGHMLFVACFSEDGNLLSQWRCYTPHGNGLSLGFSPDFLTRQASSQSFRLAPCIYEREHQKIVAQHSIDAMLSYAKKTGAANPQQSHPSQSFFPSFYEQENDLLSIAALLKNPAFSAEREWGAVSAISPSHVENPPQYRAGRTTLIPYKPLLLRPANFPHMQLQRAYLGPTPEHNLAMNALYKFLSSSGINPKDGLYPSGLPYRET